MSVEFEEEQGSTATHNISDTQNVFSQNSEYKGIIGFLLKKKIVTSSKSAYLFLLIITCLFIAVSVFIIFYSISGREDTADFVEKYQSIDQTKFK